VLKDCCKEEDVKLFGPIVNKNGHHYMECGNHSYDILGARMLWKPKEVRILKKFKKIYRSTSVIW
jgi:hypothetical protein